MKKTILFLLLFAPSFALVAQVSVGFRGGLSFPNLIIEEDGLDLSFNDFRGLALAGIAEIGINNTIAVQPELAFMQKGAIVGLDNAFVGNQEEIKFRLNYVEIPVLAKVKFGSETIAAHVLAGPSIGYVYAGYTVESGEKRTFTDDDWADFNRFETSANIGGGIGLHLPNGRAFLDVRYQISLSNISNDDFGDQKIRNKSIILNVGYLADLHKK